MKRGNKKFGKRITKKSTPKGSKIMPRKRTFKKHGEEHPRNTLLEFDDATAEISGNPVVVAWALYQPRPGAIFSKSADFTVLTGKWNTIRGGLSISSPRAGVYTLLL